MRPWVIVSALLGTMTLAGCSQSHQVAVPAVDVKEVEIRDLKRTVQLLQEENASMVGQTQEIRSRDELLASSLRRLQDENRQLLEQVKALVPAPEERDRYKARAEALGAYVLRLEGEIKRLGGTLPLPPSAPSPATPAPPTGRQRS